MSVLASLLCSPTWFPASDICHMKQLPHLFFHNVQRSSTSVVQDMHQRSIKNSPRKRKSRREKMRRKATALDEDSHVALGPSLYSANGMLTPFMIAVQFLP